MRTNESGRAQVIRGWVFLALIAGAASLDIINNVLYGVSAGGPMLAASFVIAAVGLLVLPWTLGLAGLARTACLAMTVWAACNAYLADLGKDMQAKTSQASTHRTAVADATAARAKLQQITELGDVAVLADLDKKAETRARQLRATDTAKMGTDSCFKASKCQEAEAEAIALKKQLAQAAAREQLKAEIAAADKKAAANPAVEPNAFAASLAAWTGIDADRLGRGIFLATAMLAIIVSVSVAALVEKALDLIATGSVAMEEEAKAKKAKADRRATAKVVPLAAQTAPSPAVATPPRRGRKGKLTAAEALEILRDIARQTDGRIVGSNATLAALLGVHPNTLCDSKGWLPRWEKQGLVRIESRKRGQKVVAIPAAAAA